MSTWYSLGQNHYQEISIVKLGPDWPAGGFLDRNILGGGQNGTAAEKTDAGGFSEKESCQAMFHLPNRLLQTFGFSSKIHERHRLDSSEWRKTSL